MKKSVAAALLAALTLAVVPTVFAQATAADKESAEKAYKDAKAEAKKAADAKQATQAKEAAELKEKTEAQKELQARPKEGAKY